MRDGRSANEYDYDRERRKRRWKKSVKRKKTLALIMLALIFICAVLLIAGIIVAIVKLSGSIKDNIAASDMVPVEREATLNEVDNVISNERKAPEFEISESSLCTEEDLPSEGTTDDFSFESISSLEIKADNYVANRGLIIIDAGHGGKDSGTVNFGICEKNINLNIALYLETILKARGYSVYMIREDDEYVLLEERAKMANNCENPLCMISIHQNCFDDDDSIHGTETWTFKRSGCIEFGKILCTKVAEAIGFDDRGINYKTNLIVTSKTTMPSVILECGYLSNEEEAGKLNTLSLQLKIARASADAIDEFTETYY